MLRVVESRSRSQEAAAAECRCSVSSSQRARGVRTVAEAQLNITITEGQDAAVPIAVVPFGWQGAGAPAFDIAGVVSADLGSSGRFAPMATTRHGVAADAGRRRSISSSGARSTPTTS